MKNMLKIFVLLAVTLLVGACGQMNTVIRPRTQVKQEVKDVRVIVTRADRSGVYIAVKNNTKEDIEIVWDKSDLGNGKITQGAYVDKAEYKIARKNTKIKKGDTFTTVLHREEDIYYLDPALYQPGGIKIKPLVYPTVLSLKVKKGNVETDTIINIEHEYSLDMKAVEARVERDYIKEMKTNVNPQDLREDKVIVK